MDLIEEFHKEGYDVEHLLAVSQQLHAVRKSVNPEHLHIVYDWLAFKAKHSEKMAFLDTMIFARDFMATIGEKAVQSTMEDLGEGNPRAEAYEMSAQEAKFSVAMANELRRRKNAGGGGDYRGSRAVDGDGMRKGVEEKRLMEERAKAAGKNGAKLRHGHGVGSKYRSEEERLNDAGRRVRRRTPGGRVRTPFERKCADRKGRAPTTCARPGDDANRVDARRRRLETKTKKSKIQKKQKPARRTENQRVDAAKTPTNRRRARPHRVPGGYAPGPRDGFGTVRALSHT